MNHFLGRNMASTLSRGSLDTPLIQRCSSLKKRTTVLDNEVQRSSIWQQTVMVQDISSGMMTSMLRIRL